jgi:hypothetical protein
MIYQLRNKQTGKWYNGSYWGSDVATGKCYNTLDYEVVEYDIVKVTEIAEIVTPKRLLEILSK